MTKEEFEKVRKINHYRYVDLFRETSIPITCLRKFKMGSPHMQQLEKWYESHKKATDIDWEYLINLKVKHIDWLIGLKEGTWDRYVNGMNPCRANYLLIKAFECERKNEPTDKEIEEERTNLCVSQGISRFC